MILYTAAHGGFAGEAVPLGGGAAVFDHLVEEWSRTRPFEWRTLTPSILEHAPSGADLVNFSERDYARFCLAFERAATGEILRHDPASTVVLANDISEGPDFAMLAARGYRVFTIYHVDVVAYIASIYLRGWISPAATVRWYRRLRFAMPAIARLIWEKQEASVRHSRGLIVPSAGMRDVLLACYPATPPAKIHVLPWGSWQNSAPDPAPAAADSLRAEFAVPRDAQVLVTLSRISSEKGQDRMLEALLKSGLDSERVWIFICGGAAYMQGRRFLEKLQRLAARFRRTRVIFPGHVTGERKRAFFSLADLYLFPSRHESYGLTLMEALASGCPAVCFDSLGARSVIENSFGAIVEPAQLRSTVERLLDDQPRRRAMAAAARAFAAAHPFSAQAARLAAILST